MARPEKVQVVEEITETLRQSGSVFITHYAGLTVADMTQLRAQLRDAGVRYKVVKNTLLRRAANEAGFPELADHFEGPTAIAMGPADPIPVAKILNDFSERLELPKVRAFYVEHKSFHPSDVKKLAKLPSREILLGQVVAAVEGPIAGFIGTLDAIIREFVGTVDAIARKKST